MLTPLEIKNKKFKKKMFGYKPFEVDEYMGLIHESYERLYKESIESKDRMSLMADAIKQYKSVEETMQSALVVAQSAGEEIRRGAQEKADCMISQAEARAEKIVSDASAGITRVGYRYEELKRGAEGFKAKMMALLSAQLDMLKEFSLTGESEPDPEPAVDMPVLTGNVTRVTLTLPRIEIEDEEEPMVRLIKPIAIK